MRQFSYSYNGQEVTLSVLSESDQLLLDGMFPTPFAAQELFEQDLNRLLVEATLPTLTNKEIIRCRNVIAENISD
jgi:hypothetical protein